MHNQNSSNYSIQFRPNTPLYFSPQPPHPLLPPGRPFVPGPLQGQEGPRSVLEVLGFQIISDVSGGSFLQRRIRQRKKECDHSVVLVVTIVLFLVGTATQVPLLRVQKLYFVASIWF